MNRFLPSAATLRLSRESLLVWPAVGVLNLAGYLLSRELMRLDVALPGMVMPFLTWAILAVVITAAAVRWRPGRASVPAVTGVHVALFAACLLLQWRLWSPLPLLELLADGRTVAKDIIFRGSVYATIVCAAWTQLLLRDIEDARDYERRALTSFSSSAVERLALPARYFSALLRGLAATLRKSPALCEKSTLAVARLLRRQIDAAREGMWPLVDEIRLLDEYLDLDRAHGARRRVVIHVDPASEGRVVWPGSLAVEVSSLLARPDFPIGDVSIELHESGPALRASIRAASAEHALTIEPPPVSPASRPEARLGDMASALARHHRLSIVAIMVAFWLLSTLTAALMSRSGWAAPLPLFLIAARTAARMLFVVPVVASLDSTRPVAPLRFFFAVMAAAAAGEWWIQIAIGRAFGNPWDAVFIFSSAVMLSSVAFVYVSVAATAGTLYMVRVSRVADERNRQAFVVAQRLRDAQARFLMWQTNPHFLFNALNSLVALTRSSRDSAARFLTALETFYEDMTAVRGQTHPIESEVALLARYFVIEKVRFGDAISFDALVPDEVREAEVPTLLLQPLVENATKHGAMQHGRLPITLRACLAGGRLQITVTNPADPCEAVRKAGSGLAITRERLAAMYGDAASCRTSVENGMFIAAIEMPLVIRAAGEVLQKPEFRAIATQPTHS